MFTSVIKPLTTVPIKVSDVAGVQDKPYDGAICVIIIDIPSNAVGWDQMSTFQVGEPVEIVLGDGASPVDFMIENCLQTMNVEESRAITFSTPAAGVESGASPTLEIKLELLTVTNSSPPLWKMSHSQLVERAATLKAAGVELYNRHKIQPAFWKFSKATKLLVAAGSSVATDEQSVATRKLEITLYLNIAACQLKRERFDHVVKNCTRVLRLDDVNVKAYFRRGSAFARLQELHRAADDFRRVQALDPTNVAAVSQIRALLRDVRRADAFLAPTMHHMFD